MLVTADLVTLTQEIINGKLHFFMQCNKGPLVQQTFIFCKKKRKVHLLWSSAFTKASGKFMHSSFILSIQILLEVPGVISIFCADIYFSHSTLKKSTYKVHGTMDNDK